VPPDVTACIFWLKNRDPEHWRDVQNVTHLLGKYIISDTPMSEEEWARERATALDAEPEPRFGYDREETHQDVARKPTKPKASYAKSKAVPGLFESVGFPAGSE
jgi:hypothetical protein